MQPFEANMVAVRKLVEQPEDAMHTDLLGNSQFAERTVARQQPPSARLGDCESEGIRNRQPIMLTVNGGRTSQLDGCQFLYSQAELYQPVAEFTDKFPCIEKVRHSKLERQEKQFLKQVGPF